MTSCWASCVSFVKAGNTEEVPRGWGQLSQWHSLCSTPPHPILGLLPRSSWKPCDQTWSPDTQESLYPNSGFTRTRLPSLFCSLKTRCAVGKNSPGAEQLQSLHWDICDIPGIKRTRTACFTLYCFNQCSGQRAVTRQLQLLIVCFALSHGLTSNNRRQQRIWSKLAWLLYNRICSMRVAYALYKFNFQSHKGSWYQFRNFVAYLLIIARVWD